MPFIKGNSGNPNGRPIGSTNKASGQLRQAINDFLEMNFNKIQKDILTLQPKERVKAYTDLLQYGLPKLRATSLGFDFESMSEDQLDYIIDQLKQSADDTKGQDIGS